MKTNDLILQTITKVTLFVIVLFSVYIFFAGHNNPGGGFIGGLLTSGAIVLLLLAYDLKTVQSMLPIDFKLMAGLGLLFATGTGMISLFLNKPFLTHEFGDINVPLLGEISLHTATIFDLGVYFVVVGVAMTIIQTIGESE